MGEPVLITVTSWRDLPSMVSAQRGDEVVKVLLPARFQEAIDEAAMRLGAESADDYLAGWQRSSRGLDATGAAGASVAEAAEKVASSLDEEWPATRIATYLDNVTEG